MTQTYTKPDRRQAVPEQERACAVLFKALIDKVFEPCYCKDDWGDTCVTDAETGDVLVRVYATDKLLRAAWPRSAGGSFLAVKRQQHREHDKASPPAGTGFKQTDDLASFKGNMPECLWHFLRERLPVAWTEVTGDQMPEALLSLFTTRFEPARGEGLYLGDLRVRMTCEPSIYTAVYRRVRGDTRPLEDASDSSDAAAYVFANTALRYANLPVYETLRRPLKVPMPGGGVAALPRDCQVLQARQEVVANADTDTAPASTSDTDATGILHAGVGVIAGRAVEYDKASTEERSFPEVARRFNQRTGLNLNARQAVVFLQVLKQVRRDMAPAFHRDSFVDEACYIALEAEYAAQGLPVHTPQQAGDDQPC